MKKRVRGHGRFNPHRSHRKAAIIRAIPHDPSEDVLRAIENNGEVTLPITSDGFRVLRRQYGYVFFAIMAAFVVQRQVIRALRGR